ncbi:MULTISPECIES: hypothetical protein [unclassified Micromonospora]|uniref:hypothetical protein n=1 Tax=unclassified Micromonospora TaxID=2617518 RepID=UPI0033337BA5
MWSPAAGALLIAADAAAGGGPPVELLWVGQAVTLVGMLATGWAALKTKRVDADESRRARFDARVDKELDDALAAVEVLRDKLDKEHALRLRYQGWLIRAGIDPDTGRPFDEAQP